MVTARVGGSARDLLKQRVDEAREGDAYRAYVEVRERVLDMMEETKSPDGAPSEYWAEEVAGFEYMLDAPPLVVDRLREHCYHLTGLRSFEYRRHHWDMREAFARKLNALRELGGAGLFVPESPLLGGFGHEIEGVLVNVDTLKFYECLIALDKAGLLAAFRDENGEGSVVMEIGAGWGGFAYQFKTLCPRVTYVIVDLPQSLLFSATYLKTLMPSAKVFIYGDGPLPELSDDDASYDFVFLPHYSIDNLELGRLDLAINMVSFQEMTTEQVEHYAHRLNEMGCHNIHSLNRDRSRYNKELSTVSDILGTYFDMKEIRVLPVQYTELRVPAPKEPMARTATTVLQHPKGALRYAKRTALRWLTARSPDQTVHTYRHLAGTRKSRPDSSGPATDESEAVARRSRTLPK